MEKKFEILRQQFYDASSEVLVACDTFKKDYDTWDINVNKNVSKLKEKMKEKIILGTNNGK